MSEIPEYIFDRIFDAPRELVWRAWTDAEWNDIANPMMADWPRLLLTTVIFEDKGDRTNVRLSQLPMEATDAENACFAKVMANMDKGWGSGYAIMDELLVELQTEV